MERIMTTQNSWYIPARYQIIVKGVLGKKWCDWFEGMEIESKDGMTILTGNLADQAALHGMFVRIRDLGLTLISVKHMESE
jgi:hypothetical protein